MVRRPHETGHPRLSAGDELRHCPSCSVEQVFTSVPCVDGHEDCPERVCVGCGTALLLFRVAG